MFVNASEGLLFLFPIMLPKHVHVAENVKEH